MKPRVLCTTGWRKAHPSPSWHWEVQAVPGTCRTWGCLLWAKPCPSQTNLLSGMQLEVCAGDSQWYHSCLWAPHHSSTRKFCWMRHWGQRQGRKLCLPLGKCHLWSLKGQNLGWHLVVTLARHSHLRSLRWPNSEAVSQSLFLQTFPINVADVSGWEANENSSSVHSWTSNSTLEGTMSRLIVWDVEHPNSSQGYRRRSTHLTKNELSHCLTGEF